MNSKTKFETDLREAFGRHVDENDITLALRLIKGDEHPRIVQAAADIESRCYSPPKRHHMLMTALNSLLKTHGVEYIGDVHMTDGPPVQYLNTGDTYAATLVWYRDTFKFKVQGYDEAVEWCEKRGLVGE